MGRRKKNRTAMKLAWKDQKVKRDRSKLKRLKKQAAKA